MPERDGEVVRRMGWLAVVFDDISRLRWVRGATGDWVLLPPWPSDQNRDDLSEHLRLGRCVLVIVEESEIITSAWAHELMNWPLPEHREDVETADDLREVHLERFDWLPERHRVRGQRFVEQERRRWARLPAVLRPPLTLEGELGAPGSWPEQVGFAMKAPGVNRAWIDRALRDFVRHLEHAPHRETAP